MRLGDLKYSGSIDDLGMDSIPWRSREKKVGRLGSRHPKGGGKERSRLAPGTRWGRRPGGEGAQEGPPCGNRYRGLPMTRAKKRGGNGSQEETGSCPQDSLGLREDTLDPGEGGDVNGGNRCFKEGRPFDSREKT